MNERFERDTSAIERLLHDRTLQTPPPALRTRVLTAVDAVLPKKVPATKSGKAAQQHSPDYADLVAGTFLMGIALSLLFVAMLSIDAASRRVSVVTDQRLLSFAQRAEAAGITLDVMPPPAVQLAVGQPYDTAIPRHRDTFHVLDTRSFLQGDL
jgi:hypothetical protein